MINRNQTRELQTAIVAVQQAAQLCEQVRHHIVPAALEKNDRSPVTVADFGAQAIVGQVLQRDFRKSRFQKRWMPQAK